MIWGLILLMTIGFAAYAIAVHVQSLHKVYLKYREWKADVPAEKVIGSSLLFNEQMQNFSRKITDMLKNIEDRFASSVFNYYFRNKDLGLGNLKQLDEIHAHYQSEKQEQLDAIKKLSDSLPTLGWAVVLCSISFYYNQRALSENLFISHEHIFAVCVFAVMYGLLLNTFVLQKFVDLVNKDIKILDSKKQILAIALKNMIHGKTKLELEQTYLDVDYLMTPKKSPAASEHVA